MFAATAFKSASPSQAAASICEFFKQKNIECSALANDSQDDDYLDILVMPPENDWILVLWPSGFYGHDAEAACYVSERLETLAFAVRVYEDEFWQYDLFEKGEKLDFYWSRPRFFDPEMSLKRTKFFKGKPSALVQNFSADLKTISPYLINVEEILEEDEEVFAHPKDGAPLQDPWVFVDFWEKLGLAYPDDFGNYVAKVRLEEAWEENLPALPEGY